MNISSLAKSVIQQQVAEAVAQRTGISADKSQNVVSMALPLLLGGIAKNTSTPQGAKEFSTALNDHKTSPVQNILDTILGADEADGAAISGHVLGSAQDQVVRKVAQQTNLDPAQVSQVISVVAPLVMSVIAHQQKNSKMSPAAMASTMQRAASSPHASGVNPTTLLNSFLDQNQDGSIVDDVVRMGVGLVQNILK